MNSGAAVFDLDILKRTARDIVYLEQETDAHCQEELRAADAYLEDIQEEERHSQTMLDIASALESERLVVCLGLEAELAAAAVEEAAAIASGNVVLAAEAGLRAVELLPRVEQAREAFEEAKQHRERMEKRHEMAERCAELAHARAETMRFQYSRSMGHMKRTVQEGTDRLRGAWEALQRYLDRMQPQARQAADEWFNWKPNEKEPVKPDELHDRLNVDEPVVDTMLEYLYATDLNFRASVDRMCSQLNAGGSEADVALKARKNMVGRLCEEIVIHTFLPMGERIETQESITLEDGSYTKIDMTLYGLKETLVLGRGQGMGARPGGSLAIEVKSGGKQYLYQQLEHMCRQAEGHQGHTVSCVVCTRDIKDLSSEQEQQLRTALRQAGSPIYGMLPRKDELDRRCIRFVKARAGYDV